MFEKSKLLRITYESKDCENLQEIIQYFKRISGKKLKLPFIRQKLFNTNWKGSEIIISRCHVQAAIYYLNHLISRKQLSEIIKEVKMIVAEIVPFIRRLDSEQDTTFIIWSSRTLPSFAHYLNAQELFYNHNIREDYRSNYECDVLVLYALRSTLENRIYSILGIDYIESKDHKIISLSKMIKILQTLKKIEFSASINLEELQSVNRWLNHFMHRNLRPQPWVIHQAFATLDNILEEKQYKEKNRIIHSWYGTTVVKNISDFEKEVKETFSKEFPSSNVKWLNEKEILIIN